MTTGANDQSAVQFGTLGAPKPHISRTNFCSDLSQLGSFQFR
jgi:hypothetical protein